MKAYSVVYGRTDLIGYQQLCLTKFCPSISEFIVGNNGPDHVAVETACDNLGIRSIRGGSWQCDPSCSHAHMLNALWLEAADSLESSLFLDMDVFPIRAATPSAWLQDASIAALLQTRELVKYPWPGLAAFRSGLPDAQQIRFDPGEFHGVRCDTGGSVSAYIELHSDLVVHWLDQRAMNPEDLDCIPTTDRQRGRPDDLFWTLLDNAWLHHRAASNWWARPIEQEQERTAALKSFLDHVCGN